MPVEKAAAEEVERIRSLMQKQESDVERWSQPQQLMTWGERTRRVVRFINKNTTIMDLGCGNMNLRDALPEGCNYIPADIVRRSPSCRLIELNNGLWPEDKADVVTALGLLEYLYDISAFFRGCSKIAPRLIFSYHITFSADKESERARMGMGWLNNIQFPDIIKEIIDAGGRIDRIDGFMHKKHFTQYLFVVRFDEAK